MAGKRWPVTETPVCSLGDCSITEISGKGAKGNPFVRYRVDAAGHPSETFKTHEQAQAAFEVRVRPFMERHARIKNRAAIREVSPGVVRRRR